VINFSVGCAATLPSASAGAPVAFMVVGRHGADHRLLALARGIEAALA
jgi:Asp-tRNA(Asn)/Glu-tRNA(Gln) amidotransferase A subunit family amidase